MWSNVISIDKKYTKEIDYILKGLSNTNDLSYAVEESDDRIWIYIASACEHQPEIEDVVIKLLEAVFLSYFKTRFFISKLKITSLTYAKCALLSSIVHFDRDFESGVVARVMRNSLDYNLDGLMNFRLRALRESWDELADVARRLLDGATDENDIYDIASFITGSDGGKNQLILKHGVLKNITRRKNIDVIDLFDDEEYNLLYAIISQKPCEILLEDIRLSAPMCSTLKKIARVVER